MKYRLRTHPDPVLRKKCFKVSIFDNNLRNLVNQMRTIMIKEDGVGISAPQVGVLKRVIIVAETILINPETIFSEGEQELLEGCLSFPGIFKKVKRASTITVKYQDLKGTQKQVILEGLFAVAVQHEMDHLEGKLFIDYTDSQI